MKRMISVLISLSFLLNTLILSEVVASSDETMKAENTTVAIVSDISDDYYLFYSDYTTCRVSRRLVDSVVDEITDYKYGDVLRITDYVVGTAFPIGTGGILDSGTITYMGNISKSVDCCRKNLTIRDRVDHEGDEIGSLILVDEDGVEYCYAYPRYADEKKWKLSLNLDGFGVGDIIDFAINESEFGLFPVKDVGIPTVMDSKSEGTSLIDVIYLQKYLLGYTSPSQIIQNRMDIDGDGYVDVFDLALLKRKLIEKRSR